MLRYDEDGEMMWNKAYKLGTYSHAKTVASAPNGNVLVAGFVLGVDGFYAPYIMELSDEDGSIVWIKNTHYETLPFMGKAHLNVVGDEITLDFTNGTNHEIFLSLSAEGEVLKTMKSSYPTFDYNKLEVVEEATYFYGSAQVTGGHKGMMHRTADIFEESCMIKENTDLTFTDFTEYSEIVFEPFNGEFTNQVDIAITLADLGLKVKLGCEIYLGDDSEELTTLSVYPNPATNELSISISEEMVNAVYTITDLAGKTVLTDNFTTTFMNVDLSSLVAGQYILTVSSENEVMTEKITIVR
ncbi:MAG: T9SS type A sorting domain-containing protein [Crocinitomix sp.]|nr:T9SS type A sorting domain-containing protein [Crocinitomix sp.]